MKEDKKNKSQNQSNKLNNDDLENVAGGGETLRDGRYVDDIGRVWESKEACFRSRMRDKTKDIDIWF